MSYFPQQSTRELIEREQTLHPEESMSDTINRLLLREHDCTPTSQQTESEQPECDRFCVHPKDKDYCYCNGKKIPFAWCLKQYAKSIQRGWKHCYPPYEPYKPNNFRQRRRSQNQQPEDPVEDFEQPRGFTSEYGIYLPKKTSHEIKRCTRGHALPHGLNCEYCQLYESCNFPLKISSSTARI